MDKMHTNLRARGPIHGNQIRELYSRPWQEQTAQKPETCAPPLLLPCSRSGENVDPIAHWGSCEVYVLRVTVFFVEG